MKLLNSSLVGYRLLCFNRENGEGLKGVVWLTTSLVSQERKSSDSILKVSFRKICEKRRFFYFFLNVEGYIFLMINVVIYKLI